MSACVKKVLIYTVSLMIEGNANGNILWWKVNEYKENSMARGATYKA